MVRLHCTSYFVQSRPVDLDVDLLVVLAKLCKKWCSRARQTTIVFIPPQHLHRIMHLCVWCNRCCCTHGLLGCHGHCCTLLSNCRTLLSNWFMAAIGIILSLGRPIPPVDNILPVRAMDNTENVQTQSMSYTGDQQHRKCTDITTHTAQQPLSYTTPSCAQPPLVHNPLLHTTPSCTQPPPTHTTYTPRTSALPIPPAPLHGPSSANHSPATPAPSPHPPPLSPHHHSRSPTSMHLLGPSENPPPGPGGPGAGKTAAQGVTTWGWVKFL